MGVSHGTWVLPDVTRYYSEKKVLGEMSGTAAVELDQFIFLHDFSVC